MRQFVYEVEEEELDGPSGKKCAGGSAWDCKIVYRKQRPVRTLANAPKLRQGSIDLRKAAVAIIIKYLYLFFNTLYHSLDVCSCFNEIHSEPSP